MEKLKEKVNELAMLICEYTTDYGEIRLGSVHSQSVIQLIDTIQSEILEAEKRQNLNATYAKPKTEQVNHPTHYQGSKYECIDVMLDVFGKEKTAAFCELNAFKYLWRSDSKGTDLQDKQKAIWYLNKYNELKQQDK